MSDVQSCQVLGLTLPVVLSQLSMLPYAQTVVYAPAY